MLQRRDQFGGAESSEPRRRRLLEPVGDDAVDAAAIVAAVQILEPLDRFRECRRRSRGSPDTGRRCRARRPVRWRKPRAGTRGRSTRGTLRCASSGSRRARKPTPSGASRAPVHEVVAGDADERAVPILGRERVSAIEGHAARSDQIGRRLRRRAGEHAFGAPAVPDAAPRIFGADAVHDLAVDGLARLQRDVDARARRRIERIPAGVAILVHQELHRAVRRADELAAVVVEAQALLPAAALGAHAVRARIEREVPAAQIERRGCRAPATA